MQVGTNCKEFRHSDWLTGIEDLGQGTKRNSFHATRGCRRTELIAPAKAEKLRGGLPADIMFAPKVLGMRNQIAATSLLFRFGFSKRQDVVRANSGYSGN
jgi:hypothetical protein